MTGSPKPIDTELRREELEELLRNLPCGLVLLDESGRVLLYNEEEARLSGRGTRSVEGRHFFREVAPCTDIRELGSTFRQAMADPERELEADVEITFPFEGGPVEARIRMRKVAVGERSFALLLIDDNTRLKQTERALQAALGEARELALRDPLTDLLNRRHLEMVLPVRLHQGQRYAFPLSAVMVDLDHFKTVNDRFGHEVGDRALVVVARALLQALRATDYCFRIGGEEFFLVLPGTGGREAQTVVERVQAAIRGLRFAEQPELRLTVSLGVSHADHPPPEKRLSEVAIRRELSELVRAADQALYAAKAAGRDRAVVDRRPEG